MKYISLGDTDEIAASCHHLEIAGTGVVLDAGMDPNEDGPVALPPFHLLDSRPVDHIVVTHAHHDHLGALPVLMRRIPHARVHMSKPTALLADVLLPSSARLQRKRMREGVTSSDPVFDVETVEALSYIYEGHHLDTDLDFTGLRADSPLTARFYHAGHVLGAIGVSLKAEENGRMRHVFYTSDTNVNAQTIQPGGEYPEDPVDVLFLETTLGADPRAEVTSRKAEEKRFVAAISEVLSRGGSVLIPVFALGRTQEVLALIDRFKKRRLLDKEIPVYTAGQARALSGIYDQTRFISPRLNPDFEVYNVEQQRLPTTRTRLDDALAQPAIFVVSSGMLFERTLSNRLAQELVGKERNGIFFVGFSKEESPGHRLQEAAAKGPGTEVTLDAETGPQKVWAQVERFRFSGHSHRRELINLVERIRPNIVVLVHGETAAKAWMKDNIEFFHPDVDVLIPEQGVEIEL
ncbi:MAG: MBL fold metallo-hydrolase [Rubricoccaceae bacterium]|nr:MBL fold metallo-hydrolase [Rubricoccaceae bacterium]